MSCDETTLQAKQLSLYASDLQGIKYLLTQVVGEHIWWHLRQCNQSSGIEVSVCLLLIYALSWIDTFEESITDCCALQVGIGPSTHDRLVSRHTLKLQTNNFKQYGV
jgi:hypothetical protein